jgi:hypothetical protein
VHGKLKKAFGVTVVTTPAAVTPAEEEEEDSRIQLSMNPTCDEPLQMDDAADSWIPSVQCQEDLDWIQQPLLEPVVHDIETSTHTVVDTTHDIEASTHTTVVDTTPDGDAPLTHIEIARHLEQLGLHDHLVFAIQRQEAHMQTVINRFALLMEWAIQNHYKSCTLSTLQLHIKTFISEDYDLMTAYIQYLTQNKHYQPATVVGHIDDIRICCTWFVLFRTKEVFDGSRMKQHEMLGFLTSIKHLRKILHKKVSEM